MTRNYQRRAIMRRNYHMKLLPSILWRGKCGNYRDTGVSKNSWDLALNQELLKWRTIIKGGITNNFNLGLV